MIDNHHRLRPERIVSGKASLFHDLKNLAIDTWEGFVHVFCFICTRNKKNNSNGYSQIDQNSNEQNEEQRRPLLSQ